jgi:hypothetical protein
VSVIGFDDDGRNYQVYFNGFNLYPFAPYTTRTNLKIGYLDRFEKYETRISMGFAGHSFSYEKAGERPTSITIPDKTTFQVTDETVAGYAVNNENPFTLRQSGFNDPSATAPRSIGWTSYGPEGTDRVSELPPELLEKYPFIDLNKFQHTYTSLTVSTITYPEYIGTRFRGQPKIEEYETVRIVEN